MSAMNAEIYDALLTVGAPEEQARAAATSVVQLPIGANVATKDDLGKVESQVAEVRADVASVRAEIAEVRTEVAEVRATMATREDLASVRTDVRWIKWIGGAILTTMLAMAGRLVFF